jgi:hypothetical protein
MTAQEVSHRQKKDNMVHISSYDAHGYHTENAATIIQENIQGINGKRVAVIGLDYLPAATAHTLTFLEAIGKTSTVTGCRTTTSGANAAGQAVLNVTDAPTDTAGNATAANDVIAYQLPNGTWEFNTVSSLSTKAITLGTNIATAPSAGAKVLIFGVAGDRANFTLGTVASTLLQFNGDHPVYVAKNMSDPVVFQSNNGTNAGFLHNMLAAYIEI